MACLFVRRRATQGANTYKTFTETVKKELKYPKRQKTSNNITNKQRLARSAEHIVSYHYSMRCAYVQNSLSRAKIDLLKYSRGHWAAEARLSILWIIKQYVYLYNIIYILHMIYN